MANIKVALRVRPLTTRELAYDKGWTIDVDANNSVHLHNSWIGEETNGNVSSRQFSFDYCFWSADRSSPHYASQEKVFSELGTQVLDALFDGYNACVLAYGQSGTGKTYTMMGSNVEPGIAPRLCSAIFERMTSSSNFNQLTSFRIDVSFMEIYNEKVRDLLDDKPNSEHLKVREHPKFGPYVQDLSRHMVQNPSEALELLSTGMMRRTSATTHANGHSSRSHAVFSVHCTMARVKEGLPCETAAKLHLVDLAGSERANRDLVSRLRLKEGSLINKSLATLGNVINALAERSSILSGNQVAVRSSCSSTCSSSTTSSQTTPLGSPRRLRLPFVPYRDSVLTWILKDSLGGNSRTFVLAAVSPAANAFRETLSTLRFAQRAKHILNQPVINEDASVKLIRHLKEEVARLKSLLLANSVDSGLVDCHQSNTIAELMSVNQTKARELTEDWIERWRASSDNLETRPRQNTDVGVQTQLLQIEDNADELFPVKQEKRQVGCSHLEEYDSSDGLMPFKSNNLASSSSSNDWSRDSLDDDCLKICHPLSEIRQAQKNDIGNMESKDEDKDNNNALFQLQRNRAVRSPTPPLKNQRIQSRKVPSPKPHVRTIFNNTEGQQATGDQGVTRMTSPPLILVDPPSLPSQELLYHQASTMKSNFTPPSALPDAKALLARLNSLVGKLSMSNSSPNCHNCYHQSELRQSNPESICKATTHPPSFGLSSSLVCCSTLHTHCLVHNRPKCCHHHCRAHTHFNKDIDHFLKEELLAIRRRIVARTASPKVISSLSYLLPQNRPRHQPNINTESNPNLPGEIWV